MKNLVIYTILAMFVSYALPANAEEPSISAKVYKRVLFEDEFSNEGLSKRWGMYKSATTVRDGVMVGITPEDAGHQYRSARRLL